MPRCSSKRCAFLGNPCMGGLSDAYCAMRLTPKQCENKMILLECDTKQNLWIKLKDKK